MPTNQLTEITKNINKTLTELFEEIKNKYSAIQQSIMNDLGITTRQTFLNKIGSPDKLTTAERMIIAKHLGVSVENINWQDKKNFVA